MSDTSGADPLSNKIAEVKTSGGTGQDKFVIRPLRTYEEDVASFVKRGQISTAHIMAAEQERQRQNAAIAEVEQEKHTSYLLLKISLGLLLIAGLIVWGVFAFLSKGEDIPPAPQNLRDVLIDKKEIIKISADYKQNFEVKTQVINNVKTVSTLDTLGNGELAEIMITKGSDDGTQQKISIGEFLVYMELSPPDTMIRSLADSYLFGVINVDGEVVPFLLIQTLEYQRVFSGMLDWETALYREINDIFYKTLGTNDFLTIDPNDTTGASFDPKKLTDRIIYNRDARAFIDNQDKVLFFYMFINNNHLLMTSKTEVAENLAQKLNLQNIVR